MYELKCPDYKDFQNYLSGDLDEVKIIAFEKHLNNCPLCSEAIEGYKLAFANGVAEPVIKRKLIQPKYHLSRRFIPYAAAVTLLAGLFLSQMFNWFPNGNESLAESSEIKTDNNKTLSHKSDADYWYIGSEDKIAFNDQMLSAEQLEQVILSGNNVKQVFIQVEETDVETADEIISTIKTNQAVPVFTYSKHKGFKRN